ncbi:hypothetical protein PANT_10d00109 [Moesziomyces antarcticus T-34]|uniref:Uncharacterized protein n=1 Tax=Pseudozyma antarctica (strain T-34) TaxID=1151754 RepID=M9MDC0_PSEA3|nr:hypothetical protein PANT_10d00109 [Moesziomyces antarcticus T-34]
MACSILSHSLFSLLPPPHPSSCLVALRRMQGPEEVAGKTAAELCLGEGDLGRVKATDATRRTPGERNTLLED